MQLRLLKASLSRRWRRALIALVCLLIGTALVTALLTVTFDIEAKMGQEMSSFGANITLDPAAHSVPVEISGMQVAQVGGQSYLKDADLPRLKRIFWKNNIKAFAPFLYGTVNVSGQQAGLIGTWFDHGMQTDKGDEFVTGAPATSPWWRVDGAWPGGPSQLAVGQELAQRLRLAAGDSLSVAAGERESRMTVTGIITTGGAEDDQVLMDLASAQSLLDLPGAVSRVQVNALIKPPDDLSRRAAKLDDPHELPRDDYEKWYCSPYVDSITYQINQAFPDGQAKVVHRIADAQGAFLDRLKLFFALIAIAAIGSSSLGVTATMSATLTERRSEIGLMKALGAGGGDIARQFLAEAAVLATAAGIAGYLLGIVLANLISARVFDSPASYSLLVLPLSVLVAVVMALAGSAFPVRKACRMHAIEALRS